MPNGLVIMHWNERSGAEIINSYPKKIAVNKKTMMQIYSLHEFTGQAGTVILNTDAINLVSYYFGEETHNYVLLLLKPDEEGQAYESGIAEISLVFLSANNFEDAEEILPINYNRLISYPLYNKEQKLALCIQNNLIRDIINRLRTEIIVPKSELNLWIKDKYTEGTAGFEYIIARMVELGIIKIISVQEISSDLIFLIGDVLHFRSFPLKVIKKSTSHSFPSALKTIYLNEIKSFFENYVPSFKDDLSIIEDILLNPDIYTIFNLLRNSWMTRFELEKIQLTDHQTIDSILKKLFEYKIISVIKDETGIEYYCLKSDFFIQKVLPTNNLNVIRHQFNNRNQNPTVLIKALDLLKEEYYVSQVENFNYLKNLM